MRHINFDGMSEVDLQNYVRLLESKLIFTGDILQEARNIFGCQPELIRTDTGEYGDAELNEINPKLDAAIQEVKGNE